jgi:hypothetical protein
MRSWSPRADLVISSRVIRQDAVHRSERRMAYRWTMPRPSESVGTRSRLAQPGLSSSPVNCQHAARRSTARGRMAYRGERDRPSASRVGRHRGRLTHNLSCRNETSRACRWPAGSRSRRGAPRRPGARGASWPSGRAGIAPAMARMRKYRSFVGHAAKRKIDSGA